MRKKQYHGYLLELKNHCASGGCENCPFLNENLDKGYCRWIAPPRKWSDDYIRGLAAGMYRWQEIMLMHEHGPRYKEPAWD